MTTTNVGGTSANCQQPFIALRADNPTRMSWEAFVSAGVAAAAAAASPVPPRPSEEAPETLSSPMPRMLHVPETVQELGRGIVVPSTNRKKLK